MKFTCHKQSEPASQALPAHQGTIELAFDIKTEAREYKRGVIINVASKLFYEKGFQRTTLDDIAQSIGVTKPFIYSYFSNKYDILESLFDFIYDDLYSGVMQEIERTDIDPLAKLKNFVMHFVRMNIEQKEFSSIMLQEEINLSEQKRKDIKAKQKNFDLRLKGIIEEGIAAGQFDCLDPGLASLAISGMVRWTHRWYLPEGRLGADELCDRMGELALNMVGARRPD